MKQPYAAYLDLAAAMLIVGSSVVAAKIAIQEFPIFIVLTIRFLIAAPILALLSFRNQTLYVPPKRELRSVFLQAFSGVFLFNVLLLAGLQFTTASQSGLITSTTPAAIAVLGIVLLHERLSRPEWAGVFLSAAGVLAINLTGSMGDTSWDGTTLLGNGLVMGAVVCEGLFTIFRRTSRNLPALMGATWVTGIALLFCLPFGLYEAARFDFSRVTLAHIITLIYYGVGVSVLGYFLWFRGLEHASAGAAGILSGLVPVSVIILSAIILREQLTVAHLMGLLLVLGGIGIMSLGTLRPLSGRHSVPADNPQNSP